jgi:biopolymer transport protein ExbD
MPLRTASLEEPSLNLTPMIDIVFLLIIFFMVGSRFSEIEQNFDVTLPTAAPMKSMSRQPDPLVVNIAADGAMSVSGRVVSLPDLREELVNAKRRFAGQVVLIRGDGSGRYQSVIDVMDLCQELQIRLSLAFQPVNDDGTP